jgi:hypothetical protein
MSKPKRGKNIKKIENWRGICPICSRSGVKLLWTKLVDGKTINCCKVCSK